MTNKRILPASILALTIIASLVNSHLFVYQTLASYFLFLAGASMVTLYAGFNLLFSKQSPTLALSLPTLFFILWGIYILLHCSLVAGSFNSRHIFLIISILFYLSLVVCFSDNPFPIRWLYVVILCIALLESVICIAQFSGIISSLNGYFKVTGTWTNPNVTAMFLAMTMPVLWTFILPPPVSSSQEKFFKSTFPFWWKIGMGVIILIAIFMLKCRTAYTGAILTFVIMLECNYGGLHKRNRIKGIAVLVIAAGLMLPLLTERYSGKQASADGRKLVWKISLQMIAEKPLTGYGYGLFEPNYNLHQAAYFEQGKGSIKETANASFVNMAYNELLENAVEGGVTGMLLFFGIVVLLIITYFKAKVKTIDTTAAFAGIAGFTAMSVVNFTIQAIPVMCLFLVYAAIITGFLPSLSPIGERVISPGRKGVGKGVGFILLVSASFILYFSIPYASGHLKLKQAINTYRPGNAGEVLKTLYPLENTMNISEGFLKNYGKMMMLAGNYREALTQLQKATRYTSDPDLYLNIGYCYQRPGNFAQAEHHFRLVMYMEPNRFAPRYALMQLYRQTGDNANSLSMARSIMELKPKVPSKKVDFYKNAANAIIKQNTY